MIAMYSRQILALYYYLACKDLLHLLICSVKCLTAKSRHLVKVLVLIERYEWNRPVCCWKNFSFVLNDVIYKVIMKLDFTLTFPTKIIQVLQMC